MFLPEVGGKGSVRYLEANLDCPTNPATLSEYDEKTGKLVRRTHQLDLTVSAEDREQIELTVSTVRSFIRWGVEITYVPASLTAVSRCRGKTRMDGSGRTA